MAALLEAEGLSKRFGGIAVIDELSIEVSAGEAVGIVGPNGAGKTTTLNMLAGDFRPTTGRVRFKGEDVTTLPSHKRCRRGMGRTSQVPRPFEGLTVFENVLVGAAFGGAHRGDEARDASLDALRTAGMLTKANVRAGELTLLERKRLELARALSTRPDVLLLDEIAGGLTEAEVDALVSTIQAIHATGTAIVWIEHIVHALLRVVDRMVAMDYGRVLMQGDPHQVMASDEVKSVYLGTDPDVRAETV